jgi:hypothetical protein
MFTWSLNFDKNFSLSGHVKDFFFNTQSNLNLENKIIQNFYTL